MSTSFLRRFLLRPGMLQRLVVQHRNAVTTFSGALLPKPQKYRFGLIGIGVVAVPFIGAGAWAAKEFASYLEEADIFVPDDDDDD